MRRRHFMVVAIALAGVSAPPATSFASEDRAPAVEHLSAQALQEAMRGDGDGGVAGPTATWEGFRCRYNGVGCPGTFVRDLDFSYEGCDYVLFSCIGGCTRCNSSLNPGYFCVPSPSDDCQFAAPAQYVDCGGITYYDDCVYSAALPPGEPFQTPDNCYCHGATSYPPGVCWVAECGL